MIWDVVWLVGVLVFIVSRVLSLLEMVNVVIWVWVVVVVEQFGYELNWVVCGLIIGCIGIIGLVVLDLVNLFFVSFIKGVQVCVCWYDVVVFVVDIDEDLIVELGLVWGC